MRKKAEDIQPGDIFYIQNQRLVMLQALGKDRGNDGVLCGVIDGKGPRANQLTVRYLYTGSEYEMVLPHIPLTPAQQHADELLELVREVRRELSSIGIDRAQRIDALLDKIDPPKPIQEQVLDALETLVDIINCGAGASVSNAELQKYQGLLERARHPLKDIP